MARKAQPKENQQNLHNLSAACLPGSLPFTSITTDKRKKANQAIQTCSITAHQSANKFLDFFFFAVCCQFFSFNPNFYATKNILCLYTRLVISSPLFTMLPAISPLTLQYKESFISHSKGENTEHVLLNCLHYSYAKLLRNNPTTYLCRDLEN